MRNTLSLIFLLLLSPQMWASELPLPSTPAIEIPLPQQKFLEESDSVAPEEVPTPDAQYLEDSDLESPTVSKIPLPEEKYREESDLDYIRKPQPIAPVIPEEKKSPWRLWDLPKSGDGDTTTPLEEKKPLFPPLKVTHELNGKDLVIEFGAGYAGFWGGALAGTAIGLVTAELAAPVSNCVSCRDRTIRMLGATGALVGTVEGINLISTEHEKQVSRTITAAGAVLPLAILPFVLDSGFQFRFNEPDVYYTVLIPMSATLAYNLAWKYIDELPPWARETPNMFKRLSLYIGKQQETYMLGVSKLF